MDDHLTDADDDGRQSIGDDETWMRRALLLAADARGRTSPNPTVGAVVVRDGKIVGTGFHERAGTPHAEVVALGAAGEAATGADMYVTLEPCSHHGRTPPCADRIVEAGIKRVICAHVDPDPRVSGRGIRRLREAGIVVEVGLCEREARRLNEHYLHARTTGRPWVTIKWAQTIDGQVATASGDSRWITGEEARRHAHRLRSWHDAVLVGIGTVLRDDPRLNVRMVEGRQPWHVVLDAALRTPENARVIAPGRTLILCGEDADAERHARWETRGVIVRAVPTEGDLLDLDGVLDVCAEMGFQSIFVEGGPTVVTAFLAGRRVNRVVAFIAPKILGAGTAATGSLGAGVVGDALVLSDVEISRFGDDVCVTGIVSSDES